MDTCRVQETIVLFTMDDALSGLGRLLTESVRRTCDRNRIGIVLSGGVDSTLIGAIAAKFSDVTGYVVGTKDSPDVEYVKETSGGIGFPAKIIEIDENRVMEALPKVLKAIKEPNPLKAAVGVPFYIASKKASDDGIGAMLCGQGSDELFGGYKRYLDAVPEGLKKVQEMMNRDVEEIFERQLQYDSRVCELNGVELRFPFMDERFVDLVLDMPIEEKIKRLDNISGYSCTDAVGNHEYIRKYVLRKLAEGFGVPEKIFNRPKKAAQYGSGVQKLIERVAKGRGYREKALRLGRRDYKRLFIEELYCKSGA